MYYVGPTGSDANSCATAQTIGTPKLTVSAGVACMGADGGHVTEIAAGTYTGALNVIDSQTYTVNGGTSWVNPNTVRAATGATVTIRPPVTTSAIRLSSSSQQYLIFQDLILDGVNGIDDATNGVFLWQGANHNRFQRLEITNWKTFGIGFSDSGGNSGFNEVLDCLIHDTGTIGAPITNGHGLYITSSDNLFEDNDVYDNLGYGFHFYNNAGPKNIHRNIVRRNRVFNNGRDATTTAYGLVIAWGDDNQIYNNLFYNNEYGGIQVYTGSGATQVYHNTVYSNTTRGVDLQFYASAPLVRNNIAYLNGTGIVDLGGTGTPVIENNLTTNPTFVNEGALNFHLQTTSAAKNVGQTLAGVTEDFDRLIRPQGVAYDIGAYEFDEGSVANPPTGTPTIPRLRLRIR